MARSSSPREGPTVVELSRLQYPLHGSSRTRQSLFPFHWVQVVYRQDCNLEDLSKRQDHRNSKLPEGSSNDRGTGLANRFKGMGLSISFT